MMGVRPGAPASTKAEDFRGTVRRILALLRRNPLRLASVVGFGVLMVAGMLSIPTVLGRATDLVIAGATAGGLDFGALARLLGLAVALAFATFTITVFNGRTIAKLAQEMAFELRADADRKVSSLPLRYFDSRSRGEVLSRVTNDIDNLTQTVGQVTQRIVQGLLFLVGVPIMMLTISPLLTLVVLLTMPLTVLATRMIGKRSQPRFAKQWATTGKLNGHIEEMITGHQLVTLFGRQAQGAARFKRDNEELYDNTVRAQWVAGLLGPAMAFLGSVTYVLVAVVGGLQVAAAVLTFGQIQAFIQYTGQFSNPLNMLAGMFGQVQSAVASGERVFEFLDAEEQSPDPESADAPLEAANGAAPADARFGGRAFKGTVAFEDVSFRYLEDEPLIEHLWLSAEPGQTVAIVGPTGAGKTTLVNLLMRFYDLDAGRITVDGVDISSVERERLRRRIGMVLQDTWLFDGTIAENIAYGKPDATREEVVAAASAAHADHFIRTLPDGYDTVVGAEEGSLSAGERQLVTIARAFLIDPSILILDEATSSVDTRTEMLVQQGMVALRQGRTSFVIAHRLSTIRDADVIVVMEHGQVVEQGDHEELLASGGAYARLYEAQFAQPAIGEAPAGA
ncbi:ABC transporter ATP-binding protein [Glycomyces rhizosphaerae]|uniref:ABC transporter ATP-binding protein n=1 Tax=Glycomyces rhizosphaerae TaxID=2054422 RepID=A0ABV7Q847_9ACTN